MAKKSKPYKENTFHLENYRHPDKFGELIGYRISKFDQRKFRAEAVLKIRENHLSPSGRVHGGVISAFFDFTLGAAVFTTLGPRDFCATVELKVSYLKPMHLGDVLRCKTEVVFRGKRLCVVHGYIYRDKEKQPVAMGSTTFNIVSVAADDQKGASGTPRTDRARSK